MSPEDNEALRLELIRIEKKYGKLEPKWLVCEAEYDKDSILGRQFTWDDTEAAEQWRLEEARNLLQRVWVFRRDSVTKKSVKIRAYVRDPDVPANHQGYVSVEALEEDPDRQRRAVDLYLRKVESHLRNVEKLAKHFGIAKDVAVVQRKVDALRKKVGTRSYQANC